MLNRTLIIGTFSFQSEHRPGERLQASDPKQFKGLYQERIQKIIHAQAVNRIDMHPVPQARKLLRYLQIRRAISPRSRSFNQLLVDRVLSPRLRDFSFEIQMLRRL